MASSLKLAVAALLVLGAVIPFTNAVRPATCSCKLMRECMVAGNNGLTYDFMPSEFAVKAIGTRGARNPLSFCESRCLNLLKSYLGTPYDSTMKMKPTMVLIDSPLAQHNVCRHVTKNDSRCKFTIQYGAVGRGTKSRDLGSIGCSIFTHAAGFTTTYQFALTLDMATLVSGGANPTAGTPLVATAI